MIDYKTFKKEYLNEWVDKSQAARKAAEELASKETRSSLRDIYKPQNVTLTLNDKLIEFRGEYEKKANGDIYFTWGEAMKYFGEPDKDGWRLPTSDELQALKKDFSYEFDKDGEQGIFGSLLRLPAMGYRTESHGVTNEGNFGSYWTSTPIQQNNAWALDFYSEKANMLNCPRTDGLCVCLVRDVN